MSHPRPWNMEYESAVMLNKDQAVGVPKQNLPPNIKQLKKLEKLYQTQINCIKLKITPANTDYH